MAREFWSIAIKAKKREGELIEDEPSDAEFYEMESRFFENAAKFKGPRLANGSQNVRRSGEPVRR
jgi:hypothetical protein